MHASRALRRLLPRWRLRGRCARDAPGSLPPLQQPAVHCLPPYLCSDLSPAAGWLPGEQTFTLPPLPLVVAGLAPGRSTPLHTALCVPGREEQRPPRRSKAEVVGMPSTAAAAARCLAPTRLLLHVPLASGIALGPAWMAEAWQTAVAAVGGVVCEFQIVAWVLALEAPIGALRCGLPLPAVVLRVHTACIVLRRFTWVCAAAPWPRAPSQAPAAIPPPACSPGALPVAAQGGAQGPEGACAGRLEPSALHRDHCKLQRLGGVRWVGRRATLARLCRAACACMHEQQARRQRCSGVPGCAADKTTSNRSCRCLRCSLCDG